MAPETRSRGAAPPSRVYQSSPVLQQVQFPSRRKKIRTYGRQTADRLRQQTLTQIDFVSSFDDDDDDGPLALTDSDDDGGDKENRRPEMSTGQGPRRSKAIDAAVDGHGLDELDGQDAASRNGSGTKRPVPRSDHKGAKSKRRRTLGDDTTTARAADDQTSRRRTLGDEPAPSNFHTQTLTQFLGHRSLVADSDDDDSLCGDAIDNDDGFLDWLGEQGSPSLGRSKTAARPAMAGPARAASTSARSREESVIPQTPVKRVPAIRFADPPEDASVARIDRYGPPDVLDSPLRDRSSPAMPLQLTGTPRPSLATTPTRRSAGPRVTAGAPAGASSPVIKAVTPAKADKGIREIPDSDDEDDSLELESDLGDAVVETQEDHGYGAGAETQLVMDALASGEDSSRDESPTDHQPRPTLATATAPSAAAPDPTASSDPPPLPSTPTPPRSARPMRAPLYRPHSSPPQSQPLESQRVPISILQSLPPHTARSDILLPVAGPPLAALLDGFRVHLLTPFKIPDQVVRFWLLDGPLLRYMATVEPEAHAAAHPGDASGGWRHYVKQVYELNNPVDEDDMRDEGWFDGPVARYVYLPPAVVGQLLWNLRHALFAQQGVDASLPAASDGGEDARPRQPQRHLRGGETPTAEELTISQQVVAQINSDIAHSTQYIPSTQCDDDDDDDNLGADKQLPADPSSRQPPHPSSSSAAAAVPATAVTPRLPPPPRSTPRAHPTFSRDPLLPRPSQATTASQLSTSDEHRPPSLGAARPPANSSPPPSTLSAPASQLLSKSQLLSESLVRDHSFPPPPPEIWDSDDDDAPL